APVRAAGAGARRRREGGGCSGVRRPRHVDPPGGAVVRHLDRPDAALRGDVGGGTRGDRGAARRTGPPALTRASGLKVASTPCRCTNEHMDPDFTALASRVAARAEVLGCLILSRDGLV